MTSSGDFVQQRHRDPRSTGELIRLALNEEDEHAAWESVVVLHYRATPEVLAAAERLCFSSVCKERVLGANILGQLGVPERAFPEECFRILAEMLGMERDPLVFEAIGVAFGHLHDKRAVPLLVPLSKHQNKDVRFGVVQGLSKHPDAIAIATLIELTKDEDEDVRNWATFGLGTLVNTDTAEIRAALLERVTDSHDETRGEALVGLARRKDPRVLEPIIQELSSEHVGQLALEAADALGDSRLLPALLRLEQDWQGGHDSHGEKLRDALQSCSVLERS
jgi:HEAT repeat protein